MIKGFLWTAGAIFLTVLKSYGGLKIELPADTSQLSVDSKFLKSVKIGPQVFYLPPPVDSALVKRQEIDAWFKNYTLNNFFRTGSDSYAINSLFSEVALYQEPDSKNISSLMQLDESFKRANDYQNRILNLNSLALYYSRQADYNKALDYLQQSIALSELSVDKSQLGYLIKAAAILSNNAGRFAEALNYNDYSVRLNTSQHQTTLLGEDYLRIAETKSFQKDFEEAQSYVIRKALPLFRRLGSKSGKMHSFQSLAKVYEKQNKFTEAKWYYLQALQLAEEQNDIQSKIYLLTELAQVKSVIGDPLLALADFKQAESLALQNKYLNNLVEIKGGIGETYRQMGNYVAAGNVIAEYGRLQNTLPGLAK